MGFVFEINRNRAPKLRNTYRFNFGTEICALFWRTNLYPMLFFFERLFHHVLLGQFLAQPDTSQPGTPSQTPAAQPHCRLRVHACPSRGGANCFRKSSPHLFSFLQDSLGTGSRTFVFVQPPSPRYQTLFLHPLCGSTQRSRLGRGRRVSECGDVIWFSRQEHLLHYEP